jgi:hypothetical protein
VSTDLALPFGPVFYIISSNEALCIGQINGNPFFGLFEPQSGTPFNASALNGSLIEGTSAPSTSAVQDFSGVVTLANTNSTSGGITGTQDTSTSSANTAGQTVTGTYTGLVAATGAGTTSLTAPATFDGSFFMVAPTVAMVSTTKIVMVTTTPGDKNPVVIVLGEQTDDFGVN